jgi:hypothetical protein
MKIAGFAAGALLIAVGASAQDDATRRAVEVAARMPFEKAVKGAPYSAETVIESTQTLADGNRINQKTTGRVYRDSEGRTRREEERNLRLFTAEPDGRGGNPSVGFTSARTGVSIVDPVAGYSYSLDAENKVAWRTAIGVAGAILGKVEIAATEERRKMELDKALAEKMATMSEEDKVKLKEKIAQEQMTVGAVAAARGGGAPGGGGRGGMIARASVPPVMPAGHEPNTPLEHKVIEGLNVEGRKTTTTIPAGQIGNEQPITITSEQWQSPELGVLVFTRHSDPRTGESIYRLQNIVRAEPDRSLFMVPPDYEIKETGIKRMEEARIRK